MRDPQRGILCAGCPHRAAYIDVKEATRHRRGRVICGNGGCRVIGEVHPAAATCPGGMEALLLRYNKPVPSGGTPEAPAVPYCIHFASDEEVDAADAQDRFAGLAAEGAVTVLAVNASGRAYLERDAIERLGRRVLELGATDVAILDPFDTVRSAEVLDAMLERPGVHGAVFASPCAQLQRTFPLEPVEVDRYTCVGCQRCTQITGCPALAFKPPVCQVDEDACAGCDLCSDFCRTQVIYSPRSRMEPAERSAMRYAAARS